ncbi:hypothetical protein ACVWXL_006494 [Bradyrhizobium sp. GM22.5]
MMSPMGLSECFFWVVMPGLVPGIHVLVRSSRGVDGRDKPGHDRESRYAASTKHDLGIFECRDFQPVLVADRGAVAGVDAHAVNLD